MPILYQMGCTVIACYTYFTFGLMFAWPSSTVKIFSSANTTLHRPMSETEIALFGSLSSIGALITIPLSALLLDSLGRKYSCVIISLTQVDAAKAIAFYRHVKVESKKVMQEMNKIRKALNPDLKGQTPEEEKLNEDAISQERIPKWKFLKKSRSTRRALIIVLILTTATIFQGFMVILVYAQPLFEEAIPTMSTTLTSVLLATVTLMANCIATYLVDTVGRRVLIIYCSIGAEICCLILGSQIQLHWGPHWITAVTIYLYSTLYTCGAGTVPLVLIAEVFLPEIKSWLSMICMEWMYVCNFTILFIFNPLVNIIGLGPVFYIFAGICILTAVITFFFLPETKGLAVNDIQKKFD